MTETQVMLGKNIYSIGTNKKRIDWKIIQENYVNTGKGHMTCHVHLYQNKSIPMSLPSIALLSMLLTKYMSCHRTLKSELRIVSCDILKGLLKLNVAISEDCFSSL